MEIPPISEAFTGFINGAKAANPDFPVKVTYIGNWTDTAAAKEAAISYVDAGADVLLGNADFATQANRAWGHVQVGLSYDSYGAQPARYAV